MNYSKPSSFFNKKFLLCIYTGFCSGLPLYFILQLIPAWLRINQVDLKTIGFIALTQLPYTLKFLWSPLLDKISPFALGYRKGWLLVTQIGLLLILPAFGIFNPNAEINIIISLSLITAFLSATQDIAVDAYRREILTDEQLGFGNSIHTNAYRIAGLIPGGLSLIIAKFLPWSEVYLFTAAFMIPVIIITLFIKEPIHHFKKQQQKSLFKHAIQDFFDRNTLQYSILIILFLIWYKLGDNLATALASPFYVDMNFDTLQIGTITKNAGLWPSLFGAFAGGILIAKLGLNRALWISGLVQMLSILGFVWLSSKGPFATIGIYELTMLAMVISFESIGVGMGSAALVTYISKNTNPQFTATQFALLTGLTAIPRTFINATSGILSEGLGWTNYFWLCFILAFPGMVLLLKVAPWNIEK